MSPIHNVALVVGFCCVRLKALMMITLIRRKVLV